LKVRMRTLIYAFMLVLTGLSALLLPVMSFAVGSGMDHAAGVTTRNPISYAEGSFIHVDGVTSLGSMNSSGHSVQNYFSLQLNTNWFPVTDNNLCPSRQICSGWVQFKYTNLISYGVIDIQYWLAGASSCPSSWQSQIQWGLQYCVMDLAWQGQKRTPALSITDLVHVKLNGQTANGTDTATIMMGRRSYSVTSLSPFKDLAHGWTQAEFNVFGANGNFAVAHFNPGSTLAVKTRIHNGTANVPVCLATTGAGGTYESNNLNFNSPCCPQGGKDPSITFVEGADTSQTTMTCAALSNVAIIPAV